MNDTGRLKSIVWQTRRSIKSVDEHAKAAMSSIEEESFLLSMPDGSVAQRTADQIIEFRRKHHVLRNLVLIASARFADRDCRTPRYEDWLSGSFESRMVDAFMDSQALEGMPIGMWSASLVGNPEKTTGADWALFIEIDGRYVAFILQAKRALHVNADKRKDMIDIHRPMTPTELKKAKKDPNFTADDGLKQLRAMQDLTTKYKTGLAAAYLIYDNGEVAIPNPILPLVADVISNEAMIVKETAVPMNGDLADLASYITEKLLHSAQNVGDADSLEAMCASIVDADVKRILALSYSADFVSSLRQAFEVSKPGDRMSFILLGGEVVSPPLAENWTSEIEDQPDHLSEDCDDSQNDEHEHGHEQSLDEDGSQQDNDLNGGFKGP